MYHVVHMRLGTKKKLIRHPAQWFGFGQGCQMQQLRPHGMPLASPKLTPLCDLIPQATLNVVLQSD